MVNQNQDYCSTPTLFHSSHVIRLAMALIKKADLILTQKFEVTYAQFMVLFMLECVGEQSQKNIAEKLHLTGAALSRLTETLTVKKLIIRQANPDNRRSNQLKLTTLGKKKVDSAKDMMLELERNLYGHLSSKDLASFTNQCQQLTTLVNSSKS
jgi:DNA-binding MarR family transcriptional regulator